MTLHRPAALTAALLLSGCPSGDVDGELLIAMTLAGADSIERPAASSEAQLELGRALFFDKELSGNRDTACASCHHPRAASGDGLPLAFGTGATGIADDRVMGEGRPLVPRNSTDLFNRGDAAWTTMFWDMRVASEPYATGFLSPAQVPGGLDGPLSAQALFPPTSRDEMRGEPGDLDVHGEPNELALMETEAEVWDGLMARIRAIPGYVELLEEAYPDTSIDDMDMSEVGNAIAVFEADAFTLVGSPYDRYLRGDFEALTPEQKQGGLLFFGDAGCAECHSGPLLTDQQAHNLAVPQLGPGKEQGSSLDRGRVLQTGDDKDTFCFRTPPLRNVEVTGPWMHNGAFLSLEEAVLHHMEARVSLTRWDAAQLGAPWAESATTDGTTRGALLERLDPLLAEPYQLDDDEFSALMAFLEALTDPAVDDLGRMIPDSVPSGLPVDR